MNAIGLDGEGEQEDGGAPPAAAAPADPIVYDMYIPPQFAPAVEEIAVWRGRIDAMYARFVEAATIVRYGQQDAQIAAAVDRLHILGAVPGAVMELKVVDDGWLKFRNVFDALIVGATQTGAVSPTGYRVARAGEDPAALAEADRYRSRVTEIARWAYVDYQILRVPAIGNAIHANPNARICALYAADSNPYPDFMEGELMPSAAAMADMDEKGRDLVIINFVLAHASAYGLRVDVPNQIGGSPSANTCWLMAPMRGADGQHIAVFTRYMRVIDFGWEVNHADRNYTAWSTWVTGGIRLHSKAADALMKGGGARCPRLTKDLTLLALDNCYFDTTTLQIIARRALSTSRVARVYLATEAAGEEIVVALGHAPLADEGEQAEDGPITLDPCDGNLLPPDVVLRIAATQGLLGSSDDDPHTQAAARRNEAYEAAVTALMGHGGDVPPDFHARATELALRWNHWGGLAMFAVPQAAAALRLARINLSARGGEGAADAADAAEDELIATAAAARAAWRAVSEAANALVAEVPGVGALAWTALCGADPSAASSRAAAEAAPGSSELPSFLFPVDLICTRCLANAIGEEHVVLLPNGTAPRPAIHGRLRGELIARFGPNALDNTGRWFSMTAPYVGHAAHACPRADEAADSLAAHMGKCIVGPPRDSMELFSMVLGVGGGGKSTLLAVLTAMFAPEDVGNLESNVNLNWYLTNVYTKTLIVVPELARGTKIPVSELCKIVSQELVTVNQRNRDQEDWLIKANLFMASNAFDLADTVGNMLRRLHVWLFKNVPRVSDYTLSTLARSQRFAIALRCLLHYHAWRGAILRPQRYAPGGPPRGIPGTNTLYGMRTRAETHGDMDTFVAFLMNRARLFVRSADAYITLEELKKAYRAAVPGRAREVAPDDAVFTMMGLQVREDTRAWPQYDVPGGPAVVEKHTMFVVGIGYENPDAPGAAEAVVDPPENLLEWYLGELRRGAGPPGTIINAACYSPMALLQGWIIARCGDQAANFAFNEPAFAMWGFDAVHGSRPWPPQTDNVVNQWYVHGVRLPGLPVQEAADE